MWKSSIKRFPEIYAFKIISNSKNVPNWSIKLFAKSSPHVIIKNPAIAIVVTSSFQRTKHLRSLNPFGPKNTSKSLNGLQIPVGRSQSLEAVVRWLFFLSPAVNLENVFNGPVARAAVVGELAVKEKSKLVVQVLVLRMRWCRILRIIGSRFLVSICGNGQFMVSWLVRWNWCRRIGCRLVVHG